MQLSHQRAPSGPVGTARVRVAYHWVAVAVALCVLVVAFPFVTNAYAHEEGDGPHQTDPASESPETEEWDVGSTVRAEVLGERIVNDTQPNARPIGDLWEQRSAVTDGAAVADNVAAADHLVDPHTGDGDDHVHPHVDAGDDQVHPQPDEAEDHAHPDGADDHVNPHPDDGDDSVGLDLFGDDLLGTGRQPTDDGLPTARWDLNGDEPRVLTGYSDRTSYDLSLPAGWTVEGPAVLRAVITASDIARADASLRIDVAGRPATTWTLADMDQLTLPLDPGLFTDDGFLIEASTTSPLVVEAECPDPDHVGRWVDLGQPIVDADISIEGLDIVRAVRGMARVSALTGEPITIVMESTPSPAVLETVGAVAAALGQYGVPAGWVVTQGQGVLPPIGSLVVISEHDNPELPQSIIVDAVNDRPLLRLIGTAESLPAMGHALADPDRLLFMHQRRIDYGDIPGRVGYTAREVYGFDALGYDDRTVRGSGTQGLVYRIVVPATASPQTATLALRARYDPRLVEHDAVFTVEVNNDEPQLIARADTTGGLETLVTLAPGSLRPGINYLRIAAQLGPVDQRSCGGTGGSEPKWFTVSETSALGVASSAEPQPIDLRVSDLRHAFAAPVDFAATDVVLPNNPSHVDLGTVVRLIADLAHAADGGSPRLVTDSDADPKRHLIVVGPSDTQELVRELQYSEAAPVGVIVARGSSHKVGRMFVAMTGGTESDVARAARGALSSEAADLDVSVALVTVDAIRPVGATNDTLPNVDAAPSSLAFDEATPGPGQEAYEDWLVEQALRIEEREAPQTQTRRAIALGLLLAAALLGGIFWVRKLRSNAEQQAGGH